MAFFNNVPGLRIIPLEQRTAQWHSWRRGEDLPDKKPRITGTMAAVIAGDSVRNVTPYQLWMELTGRRPEPVPSEFLKKLWAHGQALEPAARSMYIEMTGNVVEDACVEHPNHTWAASSLDGLTASADVIQEYKCPVSQRIHNVAKNNQVPSYYLPQCRWQLFCTPSARELHYFSYFPNDEDSVPGALVVVERDAAYEQWLFNLCLDFRTCLIEDRPPNSESWLIAAKGYRAAKEEFDDVDERVKAFATALTDLMPADKDTYEGGGVRLTRYYAKEVIDFDGIVKEILPAEKVDAALEDARRVGELDYEAAFKALGLSDERAQEVLSATRKQGAVDYDKLMEALGLDESERKTLYDKHRKKGEQRNRLTLTKDFNPEVDPIAQSPATMFPVSATADIASSAWTW
jgi:putative phage-type endonuclease